MATTTIHTFAGTCPESPSRSDLVDLIEECWECAEAKGFHEARGDAYGPGYVAYHLASLALIHSEVSEALEEVRKATDPSDLRAIDLDEKGKPVGYLSELADVVIRVFDLAAGIDADTFVGAVLSKMAYNRSRPHLHGKNS